MKAIFLYILFTNIVSLEQSNLASLPTSFMKPDSIPSQQKTWLARQKYSPELYSIEYQPTLRYIPRFSTNLLQPGKNYSSNEPVKSDEIALPFRVNEKSIMIKVGNVTLQVGTDYRYLPVVNRIQILNQRVLRSEKPIEIMYDTILLQNKL